MSTEAAPNPVLESLLAITGLTLEDLDTGVDEGESDYSTTCPVDSPEWRRIRDLPRRQIDVEHALVGQLSDALSTPWGTMRLRPLQAWAIAEACEHGGAVIPMAVSAGKTLVSFLIPVALGAKRPLVLVPANLREITKQKFRDLAVHWNGPDLDLLVVESYETMRGRRDFLRRGRFDLIVADEAHKLKDPRTMTARKVRRYLREEAPELGITCRYVDLTGTLAKRSPREYAHRMEWALGAMAPVPRSHKDLETWCQALDERSGAWSRGGDMGVLRELCDGTEKGDERDRVREAYGRRVIETPGVVSTQFAPNTLSCSLSIRTVRPDPDPQIDEYFHTLRTAWETPSGETFADALSARRHALTLALGYHGEWDPHAPPEWQAARKTWHALCRELIRYSKQALDSELEVKRAIAKGYAPKARAVLEAWQAIAPTFVPNPVPRWHSTEALDYAADWIDRHPRGIVWVGHVPFGVELSKMTRRPYFQQLGMCGKVFIEQAEGPIIASIASNAEGRNLQFRWHEQLVTCPPDVGAKTWEQLLGRCHRDGQPRDEVTCDYLVSCREHILAWDSDVRAAESQRSLSGTPKILYAPSDIPRSVEDSGLTGPRW